MTKRRELMTPTELYAERSRQRYAPPVEARTVGSLPPRATPDPPDEGPMVCAPTIEALRSRFDDLGEHSDDITALAHEADKARLSFSVRAVPSWRRIKIGHGLVTCWELCIGNADKALEPVDQRAHELVRALLQHVLDDWAILQPAVPLGPTLGALTCDQASRFADTAIAFANGDIGVLFTTAGHMYLATQPTETQENT